MCYYEAVFKNKELMEDFDNYYNEEDNNIKHPNDGLEEVDIEPISWDDM